MMILLLVFSTISFPEIVSGSILCHWVFNALSTTHQMLFTSIFSMVWSSGHAFMSDYLFLFEPMRKCFSLLKAMLLLPGNMLFMSAPISQEDTSLFQTTANAVSTKCVCTCDLSSSVFIGGSISCTVCTFAFHRSLSCSQVSSISVFPLNPEVLCILGFSDSQNLSQVFSIWAERCGRARKNEIGGKRKWLPPVEKKETWSIM